MPDLIVPHDEGLIGRCTSCSVHMTSHLISKDRSKKICAASFPRNNTQHEQRKTDSMSKRKRSEEEADVASKKHKTEAKGSSSTDYKLPPELWWQIQTGIGPQEYAHLMRVSRSHL